MTRRWRRASVVAALGVLGALVPYGAGRAVAGIVSLGLPVACHSSSTTSGDFNGDGVGDLAIGAPGDGLEQSAIDSSASKPVTNAGSVSVVYGVRNSGLDPSNPPQGATTFLSLNTPGVRGGPARSSDNFGYSLVAGDFNGDGISDLAVSAPGKAGGGEVHVFYGSRNRGVGVGVFGTRAFNVAISEATVGLHPTGADDFGYALAVGDFNRDGVDDLVIGAPGYNRGGGEVVVVYGAKTLGISPGGATVGSLKIPPAELIAGGGGFTGAALATGNFNASPVPSGYPAAKHLRDDLAVGAPGLRVGSVSNAGAVGFLYAKSDGTGLPTSGGIVLTMASPGLSGLQTGALFGCSLAAANYDRDLGAGSAPGDDDLAVGAPGENVNGAAGAGEVVVVYSAGANDGITTTPPKKGIPEGNFWTDPQEWTQDDGGIPGIAKAGDHFGQALAVGDFDADGVPDLAVGVPGETLYGKAQAGSLRVLSGFAGFGLTDLTPIAMAQSPSDLSSACLLYQELKNGASNFCIPGGSAYSPLFMVADTGDQFASSITVGNFDGRGGDDLAIGVPHEALGLFVNDVTEEVLGIPTELASGLSLSIDEAKDAGVVNVVYAGLGGFPQDGAPPATQDLIYRSPSGGLSALYPLVHNGLCIPPAASPVALCFPKDHRTGGASTLDGDLFGSAGS